MKPRDDFFTYASIETRYRDAVLALHDALSRRWGRQKTIVVFGELVGGEYPHPDVPSIEGVGPVQKDIWYSPDVQWCAFDVRLANGTYLNPEEAEVFLTAQGFIYPETLYEGPLNHCIYHPTEFPTRFPAGLGLPQIPGNLVEGVIIRTLGPVRRGTSSRLVFKRKSPRWYEVDPASAKEQLRREKRRRRRPLGEQGQSALAELLAMVCLNRLKNVASHHGEVRVGDLKLLQRGLWRDVFSTFDRETPGCLSGLPHGERHRVEQAVKVASERLVEARFFELLTTP